jgi:hypothetical protein
VKLDAETINRLREVGIADSSNASEEDSRRAFRSYVVDRKIDVDLLRRFLQAAAPTTKAVTDALKHISGEQSAITGRVLEIINSAIQVCETHMAKADSADERLRVLECVLKLVEQAREEGEKGQKEQGTNRKVVAGVAILAVGLAVFAITRNTTLLRYGAKVATGV